MCSCAFHATPYPGTSDEFTSANDCVGGLIAFDIPASEHAGPSQIVRESPVAPPLRWEVPTGKPSDYDIIGTARPFRTVGAWIAVTGYTVRPSGAAPGARTATATATVQ